MAEVKNIATRDAYGAALCELAEKRQDFVVFDFYTGMRERF